MDHTKPVNVSLKIEMKWCLLIVTALKEISLLSLATRSTPYIHKLEKCFFT